MLKQQELGSSVAKRYLDYSMHVIIQRALPDVRDGLKPVQRRILYGMNGLGLNNNKPYKKSARTVGEVLGKLHPHGETSVYGAMVNLAQDFSTRYPLVDGHGNFGSVDGDNAAAMRYTEAKMSKITEHMMLNINKNTVDFKPNYDGEEREPSVLSTLFPTLLANGSFGIAVGMSTNIPPHNLRDIYSACNVVIENAKYSKETDIMDVIKALKAPDFPTGGSIVGLEEIVKAYKTGKGRMTIRGKHHIEETDKHTFIIIDEIPYKVNKAKFIEKVYNNIKDIKNSKGTIEKRALFPQIKDIRDESNKDGVRIVIELKKDENPDIVVNNLIKQNVGYQVTESINLLALKGNQPKTFNILEIIEEFLTHASEVIIRRTQFDLEKATKRLNFVNGILFLFKDNEQDSSKKNLEYALKIIKDSNDPLNDLINLGLNQSQAEYILDMKLRSLSKASIEKLNQEKKSLETDISIFNSILTDDLVLLNTIQNEFSEIEKKFGDDRRTDIISSSKEITDEDLIDEETLIITYTTDGIIKAVEEKAYNTQKRGGKGTKGTTTKEDEMMKFMFTSSSKDDLLFFTNLGKCYVLKAYKIGKSTKSAKGKSINNYLELEPGEKIVSILNTNIKNANDSYLIMITKGGTIKKLNLSELSSRYSYTRVIKFKANDTLVQALLIKDENILIVTKKGMSLRIDTLAEGSKAIRPMGRLASGVTGITLKDDVEVIDMSIINDDMKIITLTEHGLCKITEAKEWKIIGRAGKGGTCHKINEKTGSIISVISFINKEESELFIATQQGQITRIPVDEIRSCSKYSSGVKAINLSNEDKVVAVSLFNVEKSDTE